ncbi:glutathione S-transferase zeta class-like isoform X1 [Salvia miltiorrhiza]|uniref:glutathione S-transferase zeta class-like isoform X1 n=1 Tax=Salvia miltiorrhiza TaxID=226208 RepID=UPI0025AC534C|nr:glutathione S-transferase zeta class-like isoform X1 [Salvia miltiorrhiza]
METKDNKMQMHRQDESSSSSPSAPKLVLYSYWQSSCAWRIRFALNLKGLSYEYRAVNLDKGEQFTPEFEKLNPLHYVPVLVDGDVVVSDSYAIILHLEENYPQNPLLPSDPQLRAINLQKIDTRIEAMIDIMAVSLKVKLSQAASIVSSSIQPLLMMTHLKYVEEKFGPAERAAWVQIHIGKGFSALEKLLKGRAGTYSTGDTAYMADVFLAPQIAVAANKFNVDMSKFPTLDAIYKSCIAMPEFEASLPERQPDAIHALVL